MAEIVVLNGVCEGTVFVLPDIPTVLGRSPESHVQIGDPWISSMHAMFERRGEEVWVIDLESRNGTYLAHERVAEARIPDGALLRFGRTEVRFNVASIGDPLMKKPMETPAPRPREQGQTTRTTSPKASFVTTEPEVDPLALSTRRAAVLRLSLHAEGLAGSEEVSERINAALDACLAAVAAEGGAASKLSGVGVLGLFGLSGSRKGDISAALGAARASRTRVREFRGLDLCAGLDAGEVLAGRCGANELGALGPPAQRAERLAALAKPGEILVGAGAAEEEESVAPAGTMEWQGDSFAVFRDESDDNRRPPG